MPKYFFTAKSLKGESHTGSREAKDKHELARILRHEGYVLISAALEGMETKKGKFDISIPLLGGVSLKEKIFLTRNLRIMISAGVSLPRSLEILALQTKKKELKTALLEVREEVIKGKSFSESLSLYPKIFSELFCSMTKVGEEAGTLEEVLKNLTYQMERENELQSKIKGAMIYPAVIILAMLGVGIMMLVTVVPKLAETFEELNIELPLTTKVTIGIGMFLTNYWYLLPFIVLALLFFLRMISKTEIGKRRIDSLTLKIPIISPITRKTNSAHTARTLASLIASGVPIVRALEIISRALGNIYFKKAMADAAERVRKGAKLSEVLKEHQNVYPLIMVQMIEVGEETGQTSDILQKLADFFEEEVTAATKNLASVIEPILMLFIGVAVGFFAVSMIQPMYSMLGAL